ncbi:zinc-dependent metalloprotease [Actinocorallia sp. A-T 12471]|uniref:zinc-dependent metalloprotease n=1 Tax=Actinocorallia sp. A-T 12471 TaxID=3089813 RepID=UPI0029CE959F|nr:zinc-dependent metalloprotease [Actinocorallia sp. A-T 12471]MDX6738846.1 zinc-dependent metalloprotease [Actinocorallia sp. A-T 12471]
MGDTPFGFNRPGDDDGDGKPGDPFGMGFGMPGMPPGGDMRQFADMLRQFADMLSGMGSGGSGPVNWEMVRNIARHLVVEAGDPSVVDAERRQVEDALRLADLWLDEGTTLPAGIRSPKAWSRSEWLEATLPVWEKVVDPIAERMTEAMGGALGGGENIPPEMAAMAGPLIGMVRQMAGAMVAGQAGQALGALAKEIIGSADVGLPLAPEGVGALLPSGVAAFAEGLEIPADEVRLYLALREAAHQRLFAHVPWLRSALLSAVGDYARGISVDLSGLEEKISGLDLSDPAALQEALGGGEIQLTPEETPEQKLALSRLETLLALVEGWVGVAVAAASANRLPSADRLAEAIRRRRATGGPAEHTFAALVGLELRPRRLREAETLWQSLTALKGVDGRDALWSHPDLMPTAADLEDPDAFLHSSGDDFDLSQLEGLPPAEDQGGDGKAVEDEDGKDKDGKGEDGKGEGPA